MDMVRDWRDAQTTVRLLRGRWVLPILAVLAEGSVRHNELLRRIDGIHHKVLGETLARMEQEDLVTQRVSVLGPSQRLVHYELTDLGVSLATPVAALAIWARAHGGHLDGS